MLNTNKKGFTMVELLVVLVIIGILAAVAAPLYLANTKRAKASEAVATMSLIRQGLRDYKISTNTFFDIHTTTTATGNIQKPLPSSVTLEIPSPVDAGLDIDSGVNQYFSSRAFSVDSTAQASTRFTDPGPVDFLIVADGKLSLPCTNSQLTDCAIKAEDVGGGAGDDAAAYIIEMDNSGRIFVSYDNGAANTWSAY